MEPDLEVFLRERRAVTDEALEEMKYEKIDMAAIIELGPNQLEHFIPKIGDRLATVRYCKFNGSSKTSSLVERIKKCQSYKENCENKVDLSDTKKNKNHTPNFRITRLVRIGWIMNGITVREKKGGGTRTVSIEKSARKDDVLKKALDLFFPNNISHYGPLSKFSYDILDYKQHKFSDLTIGEMYDMTGLNTLRFYLSTINEDCFSSDTEETVESLSDRSQKCAKGLIKKDKCANKTAKTIQNQSELQLAQSRTDIVLKGNDQHDEKKLQVNEIEIIDISTLDNSEVTTNFYELDEFLDAENNFGVINNNSQSAEALSSSKSLILHRGQVFEEMTQEFIKIGNINTYISVEIYGTNGMKENAFDGGGVFKDALTEYWNEFYERICLGSCTKVPEVNHMVSEEKWKAMARILLIGYRQVNYFPIQISKPFMENSIFGETVSDLINAYMEFISPLEADILNRAILNFDDIDKIEIVDVLSNLDCKQFVNKNNINSVIKQLAHTEIIQKSIYISQLWSSVLKDKFTPQLLNSIYKNCEVTNSSVLKLIESYPNTDLDMKKERSLSFLKKLIREADTYTLKKFLRFCTGADLITCDSINVEFTPQGSPTSHTCNNILVLPNYDSYRTFKMEFTNILKSNMWCMDII